MKISDTDRNLLIMLLKKEAIHKQVLVDREPQRERLWGRFIKRCDRLVVGLRSEESLQIDSQKPKITIEQMNRLLDRIDDVWMGKTPFVCADGSCSDRVHTTQADLIWDFFTIIKENND